MQFIFSAIKYIQQKILSHKKVSCFVLGMLSARALPPFHAFPVLFLTFSAFLLILNTSENKKQSFAFGYWFGFGYFACNMAWTLFVWAAYLIYTAVAISRQKEGVFIYKFRQTKPMFWVEVAALVATYISLFVSI